MLITSVARTPRTPTHAETRSSRKGTRLPVLQPPSPAMHRPRMWQWWSKCTLQRLQTRQWWHLILGGRQTQHRTQYERPSAPIKFLAGVLSGQLKHSVTSGGMGSMVRGLRVIS